MLPLLAALLLQAPSQDDVDKQIRRMKSRLDLTDEQEPKFDEGWAKRSPARAMHVFGRSGGDPVKQAMVSYRPELKLIELGLLK